MCQCITKLLAILDVFMTYKNFLQMPNHGFAVQKDEVLDKAFIKVELKGSVFSCKPLLE